MEQFKGVNLQRKCQSCNKKNFPKDLGKIRIKNDEKVVQHCCSIVKSWQNPFEHNEKIVGLSSQIEAPPTVQKDLMNAATIGESSFKDFIKNRIESNNFGFYEPIKKNKLRNFDTAIITKIMRVHGKDIAIKSDRETFVRLLVIQRTRKIDIKEVLRHELSPVPLALSNPDTASTLCKTAKNELFKFLKISLGTVSMIPMNTPKTYDGMVLLEKLPATLSTFGDIFDFLINKIVKGNCKVCFFVTDYYLPNSIKSLERKSRSVIGLLRMKVSKRDH